MIILRRWTYDDLNDLYEFSSDEATASDAAWNAHKNTDDSCKVLKHYIESDEVWAIEAEKKAVGCIGLHRRANGFSRMLEYVVNKDFRGRGIATHCVKSIIKYAFDTLKLKYMTANCYSYNTASENVLIKCGFKYIKLLPNKKCDIKHYRLYKEDYLKNLELYNSNAVFK